MPKVELFIEIIFHFLESQVLAELEVEVLQLVILSMLTLNLKLSSIFSMVMEAGLRGCMNVLEEVDQWWALMRIMILWSLIHPATGQTLINTKYFPMLRATA